MSHNVSSMNGIFIFLLLLLAFDLKSVNTADEVAAVTESSTTPEPGNYKWLNFYLLLLLLFLHIPFMFFYVCKIYIYIYIVPGDNNHKYYKTLRFKITLHLGW